MKSPSEDDEKWLNPRLFFIKSISKPLPRYCPECRGLLDADEDETICTQCGLVTSASIEYTAGMKVILPHGRH